MKYSDKNQPIACMLTNNVCYKNTTTMIPRGVLWHDTDAGNPYISRYVQPMETDENCEEMMALLGKNRHGNDWNHSGRRAGVNCFIGKLTDGTVTTIQTMPWNYAPWGCGDGSKGSLNNTHMQFEICDDGYKNKEYFETVYKEACEITAYYCKMYNLNPLGTFIYKGVAVPVITNHDEAHQLGFGNNHSDTNEWMSKFGKTMDDARRDVAKLMGIKIEEKKEQPRKEGVYVKGKATKLSTNFNSTEFDCNGKNCCLETIIDKNLVTYLQKIRSHFGKPVNITSAYRCEKHNKKVGGSTGSYHTKGQAADIYINGVKPIEIARYAESLGIKGIGLYETEEDGNFVHIDTRTSKFFWYGQAQEKRDTFQEKKEESNTTAQQKPATAEKRKTLRNGDKGDEVRELQILLKKLGFDCKGTDGIFGANTQKSVTALQKERNISPDGVCGPLTWAEIDGFAPYKVSVTANKLNVREKPDLSGHVKTVVTKGPKYTIVYKKGDWGKLENGAGWVVLEYVEKI